MSWCFNRSLLHMRLLVLKYLPFENTEWKSLDALQDLDVWRGR